MTTDATQVTGSPLADGARTGDVLAERYELLEAIDVDGPSLGYRALDHETERQVLVRTLAGAPLDERTLGEVLERLRGLVGVGGRYLSPLVDADRENRRPFTVEPWPSGTQLSAILQGRRARGAALGPREALPVIARLEAALAALPEPWHHGDVRSERVWVDTEGLRLTGAYLLAALPPRLLAERLEALGPGALVYAPEVSKGRGGTAADRWGVAAIAWEALTARAPDLASAPPELTPPLLEALRSLLDPEPARRPTDLRALIEALAAHAGLAVPHLDPEPHRPPAAAIGAPPGAARATGSATVGPRVLPRRIDGAALGGTQEIALDDIEEITGPDGGANRSVASADHDLDPRLVRAAFGVTLESDPDSDPDSLDPRLVRAALGVTSDETSDVEELPSDELEAVDEPASAPSASGAAAVSAPPGAVAPRPAAARAPATGGSNAVASHAHQAARAASASSVHPREPAPSAAPRGPHASAPSARPAAATNAPGARPAAAASPPGGQAALAHAPAPTRAPAATGAGTAVVGRRSERTPAARRSVAGPLIVIGAILLAIAIVGAGFLIRSMITHERDSAERARHIQERLQQHRREEGAAAP